MSKLAQAIDNTIAWLETNPYDRCTGNLAQDEHGDKVSVLDPDACSWCALGYLARELKLDAYNTDEVYPPLYAVNADLRLDEIWNNNDRGRLPAVIQNLRTIKDHIHE
ncbi:hypothetical protein KNJ79_05250 [Sphingopyxis indica]|uniref:hypothetical protein n=1 Tax=Sphingopyxis indica TaxID=436663 RepID=UPI002938F0D7|nr:hypothetical protein [Sphingopyxis indica]WOF44339.1 hypothetical protein KNJ79_05250 [Sphingopyxis indica]